MKDRAFYSNCFQIFPGGGGTFSELQHAPVGLEVKTGETSLALVGRDCMTTRFHRVQAGKTRTIKSKGPVKNHQTLNKGATVITFDCMQDVAFLRVCKELKTVVL